MIMWTVMKEIPGILVIVRIQFLVPKIAVWMEFLQKTGLELMELVNKVIKVSDMYFHEIFVLTQHPTRKVPPWK